MFRLGVLEGVCSFHRDSTRGLAPFVEVGEVGFRAETTTGRGILDTVCRLTGWRARPLSGLSQR